MRDRVVCVLSLEETVGIVSVGYNVVGVVKDFTY